MKATRNRKAVIERLKKLIGLWEEFHTLYRSAVENKEFTAEAEQRFLQVKSELARSADLIYEEAGSSSYEQKELLNVILQLPSLKSVASISDMQARRRGRGGSVVGLSRDGRGANPTSGRGRLRRRCEAFVPARG